MSGTGTVEEFEEGNTFTLQMHSLFPVRETMVFESGPNDTTVLSVDVSHEVPGKVLSFLFTIVMKTVNVREAKAVLERIRALCEKRDTLLWREVRAYLP